MNNKGNNHLTGLLDLGMSEREAKVYLAMLNKREASLTDLQKLSGVRSNKIGEVVNSLVRQGFCTEKRVGNRRFLDVLDPRSSLKSTLEVIENRLDNGNKLKKSLGKLYDRAEEVKEPFEYIEIIHGNDNINKKFIELVYSAEFEILNFMKPPFASVTEEMYKEQIKAFDAFIAKEGKIIGVFEVNETSPLRTYKVVKVSQESGEIFRIAEKLPLKLFIFDRKTLLITEKSSHINDAELSMTIIKQNTTVEGYIALFNFFWEQALDYEKWIKGREELMDRKLAEYDEANK